MRDAATIPTEAETATRDGFLDAAERCFERFGMARTTMGEVAKAAGVHRTTLYRYFADRDALVMGVLLREAVPIIERAAARMASAANVPASIADSLVLAIAELRESPHLAALLSEDSAATTAHVALMSAELAALAQAAQLPVLERARSEGLLRPGIDLVDATRWLTRIAFSFVGESPTAGSDEHRRLLRTYVLPSLFLDV